jgi:hypothetical protein
MTPEQYIDHEVRVRLLERTVTRIEKLGYWILGSIVMGIALPVSLHYYHLI